MHSQCNGYGAVTGIHGAVDKHGLYWVCDRESDTGWGSIERNVAMLK